MKQIFLLDMRPPVPSNPADDPRQEVVNGIVRAIVETDDEVLIHVIDDNPGEFEVAMTKLFLVAHLARVKPHEVVACWKGSNTGTLTDREALRISQAVCFLKVRNVEVRCAEPWMLGDNSNGGGDGNFD